MSLLILSGREVTEGEAWTSVMYHVPNALKKKDRGSRKSRRVSAAIAHKGLSCPLSRWERHESQVVMLSVVFYVLLPHSTTASNLGKEIKVVTKRGNPGHAKFSGFFWEIFWDPWISIHSGSRPSFFS
jgi:hypothetical protein